MSIFNDKVLKSVAEAALKVMQQESSHGTEPKHDKEKKLAALAHPKDKITHKDVLVGRGVLKKEEAEQVEEGMKMSPDAAQRLRASVASKAKGGIIKTTSILIDKGGKTVTHGHVDSSGKQHVSKVTKEETEQLEEGFDDMQKYLKAKAAPQPSGGAGKKSGTRYGGSKQAPDVEDNDDDDKKPARGKYGARQNYKRSMKESFSSMIETYNEGGLKSLSQKLVSEEPDNEQFTKELEDQKASMEGKKKQPSVSSPSTQGVKNMPEEVELNADEINGVAVATISEELTLEDFSFEELEEFMMSEEYEQLDEVSKKTLASYVKKASHDVATKGAVTRQLSNDSRAARERGDHVGARKDNERADKVFAKSWHRRMNMAKAVDRLAKEEVELDDEQMEEGVQQTLRKYVPGYAKKQINQKMDRAKFGKTDADKDANYWRYKKVLDKTNEEVELDERTLTPGEKKEMEKNVKGMKKKLSGFKDRYGDRAKEVMYATATKMAKKED